MSLPRAQVEERLAQVEQDLADVDRQRADGELDDVWAERLRATYVEERNELQERLAAFGSETEPATPVRSGSRRLLAGAIVVVVAAVGITIGAVAALQSQDAAAGAEGVVSDIVGGQGVDLSQVSNEQLEDVIAQFPDNTPMRLALARRYFYAGEFDKALDHYMIILDEEQNPEALANVGWMTFLSGEPEVAVQFVEKAIEIAPEAELPYWYLANIRLDGLDDPAGAVAPLETLLGFDDLPDDLRTEAEGMLNTAREGAG